MQNQILAFIIIVSISPSLFARPLDKAETFTLDNGLVVVTKSLPGSGLAAIQMLVRGGLLAEGEYLGSGISHFIEHMLFKGTDKRGPGKIAEELNRLGGELNGATSLDHTYYEITLPREHLAKGLEILSDTIRNSAFSEDEVAREKEVILKEINMGDDDPSRRLWKILFQESFLLHPYREPVIGRRSFFERLTRDDLASFYKSHYLPQCMVLAIAGGIDKASVREEVEKCFKDWKPVSNYSIPFFKEPAQISLKRAEEYFPSEKVYMAMGFHIPGIESEDLYGLDLVSFILGRGKTSRLYMEIKEKKSLADEISVFSYTPSSEGLFCINAVTDAGKEEALEKAVMDEIERIKKYGVTEKELDRAKKIVQSEHRLSLEKAESVAADIAYSKMFLGQANFSEYYIERIGKLKREEIKEAVKFLNQNNLTICILGLKKEKEKKEVPEAMKRVIKKSESGKGFILLTSKNEITPMVSVNLLFKGGVICEESEKNGIFSLLSRCLIRSTKTKDYQSLHSEIESAGGSLSSYSGYNSFGISLMLPSQDIELGLRVMASLVREPLFKEEDINKAKEEILAEIKTEDDDILQSAFNSFRETIFNKHPYAWRDKGKPETIEKITRHDIISFYKRFCLGTRPVLAISGDIDEGKVIEIAEKDFSFLNQYSKSAFGEFPTPQKISSKKNISLPRKQAIVVLGFPGVSVDNKDRFAMDVITGALSGQSGRLYSIVREKKGHAYFVGAFQILGLVPGAVVFYAGTSREHIDEVKDIMLKEIERLKKEFLPEDEIQKVKENIIGQKRISLETNSSFGFDCGLNELYGLGCNFYIEYEKSIRELTPAMLRETADKYFRQDVMSCLMILPAQ